MSEQPKEEEEPFEPVPDPRFANETPEERKARGQRALATLQRMRERGVKFEIDIDELRGRKHS
jgi:hypothetical protein